MVDADVIAAKLSELSQRVERMRQHCPPTSRALENDRDALDLVSFNLMLAVQSCLDIASHIIADEGWEPATTLAGSFRRLQEQEVIDTATAKALGRAAGLRNILAHGYAAAEPQMIHTAAQEGSADLERFASEVGSWLAGRLGSSSD
jgi:uncharacterized protein YutE (UPF0331/DUF86 family)